MASKELRFFRYLFRKLDDLGSRRTIPAGVTDMTVQMTVKLVMLVGVVMDHQAAGRWIDRNPLDPRREGLGDLLHHFKIALGARDFHADPPGT